MVHKLKITAYSDYLANIKQKNIVDQPILIKINLIWENFFCFI